MQMVAAAKLRKAQEAAEASRPYSDRLGAIIGNLAASMAGTEGGPELLVGNGKSDTVLLVVAKQAIMMFANLSILNSSMS